MRWQCWQCSSDDGCELIDLVGEEPLREPTVCPFSGVKNANFKRVEDAPQETVEAQDSTTNTGSPKLLLALCKAKECISSGHKLTAITHIEFVENQLRAGA